MVPAGTACCACCAQGCWCSSGRQARTRIREIAIHFTVVPNIKAQMAAAADDDAGRAKQHQLQAGTHNCGQSSAVCEMKEAAPTLPLNLDS